MKARMLVPAILLAIFCSSWTMPASMPASSDNTESINKKPVPTFAFFRVHKQGTNGITATWGLESNAGVTNFILQRTYEDPTDPYSPWDNIAIMSAGNGKMFKFTDNGLAPGFISYRVLCMNGETVVGMSVVITYQSSI